MALREEIKPVIQHFILIKNFLKMLLLFKKQYLKFFWDTYNFEDSNDMKMFHWKTINNGYRKF